MSDSILLVLIPIAVVVIAFTVFKMNKKKPESTLQSRAGGHGKTRTP